MRRLLLLVGLILVLGLLFFTTNPDKLPSAIFMLVFLLLYAVVFLTISLLGLLCRNARLVNWRTERIQRTAALIALLPVFLLVLQSIGQLTLRDVLLATGLFVLLYFYFNRLSAQKT